MDKPTLAVWKLASCDGCQLTVLDCEDELLALAGRVDDRALPRGVQRGDPWTVRRVSRRGLDHDAGRCRADPADPGGVAGPGRDRGVRDRRRIQALRNFGDVAEFASVVYARPDYIETLATSTPVSEHVAVDYELRGCPIDRRQLLEVLTAFLAGRKPDLPDTSVCTECKRRGLTCVMVADGTPCLGPVTHAGCGALCPAYKRGCFGCFGPMAKPNVAALVGRLRETGMSEDDVDRVFHTFNAAAGWSR